MSAHLWNTDFKVFFFFSIDGSFPSMYYTLNSLYSDFSGVYSYIFLLILVLIYSLISNLFIWSLVHLFTHSLIHSFILSPLQKTFTDHSC